jgi:signal peptidase I
VPRGPAHALALAIGTLAVAVSVLAAAFFQSARAPSAASPTPLDLAAICSAAPQPGFVLYRVLQSSMEPLFEPDETLVLATSVGTPARGQVVVFNPPSAWAPSDGTPFIKRVVGLRGETLELRDGRAYVGGMPIDEPYVEPGVRTLPSDGQTVWQIPAGQVFVMGDRRTNSADSRVFGPIPLASLVGRPVYRCLPKAREGPIQ